MGKVNALDVVFPKPIITNDSPLSLPYFRAASENQIINPVIMHFKSNQWKC